MRKLLLVSALALTAFCTSAQTRVIKDSNGMMVTEVNYNHLPVLRYKGSLFLKDSVQMGTFAVAGGEVFQKPVLFDLLNQSFLADFGTKIVPLRDTDMQMSNRFFKNINHSYFETSYDAKVKILARYSCTLKDFEKGGKDKSFPKIDNDFVGEVVHKTDYFLLFPDNKLRAIDLSNYSVSLALDKEYGGLSYYIKKWNRKITTVNDLVDLLKYLDSETVL